ncbi:MAG: ligase-associated DNA damage response endonuclease PdeM [Planktomarina sp.]
MKTIPGSYAFRFYGADLVALPSGALWWPRYQTLCVSDLHLGKAERIARRGGGLLPPYETQDTLLILQADIDQCGPGRVICLGDSFDDLDAVHALSDDHHDWLMGMQAGRNWIWIEGNHDPGPLNLPGQHMVELRQDDVVFRHIALTEGKGEISGHYHPKARLKLGGRTLSRSCFLWDQRRVIMPAFGTYTGGLNCTDAAFHDLMAVDARAILTGQSCLVMPMPTSG